MLHARTSLPLAAALSPWLLLALGCGGGAGGGGGGGTGGASTGTLSGTGAGHATTGTGAGSSTGPGGGQPTPTCPAPLQPADASHPDAVVGTGTAASCTEHALEAALAKGGVVTFDCGAGDVTITVTSQKDVTKDTVLEGGGKVTLSGGGTTRILHVASAWNVTSPKLTVQHLHFTKGFTTDAPNTHATDQGGAAIFREGGTLEVIDCQFDDNHCAQSGQDVSGGAITSQGEGPTTVVGSSFTNNSGSNGGAIGNLGNDFTVVNSTFANNHANGAMGNPGNGGDGGALVFDGAMTKMVICGSVFTGNTAGAQGGAVFRVAYTDEPTTVDKCTFDGNASAAMVGLAGALYLENTTIEMTATTISNNTAHYGGGFWIGHAAIAHVTNTTIANNTADQGGGVWVSDQVTGLLLNVTLANNTVTPGGYAPGWFGGDANLEFQNTIVEGGGCKDDPLGSAGTNLQYPDASSAPCMPSPLTGDPKLGPLMDNGGPTKTVMPAAGSPAIGAGSGCPKTDQRGETRGAACTLGAVDPSAG